MATPRRIPAIGWLRGYLVRSGMVDPEEVAYDDSIPLIAMTLDPRSWRQVSQAWAKHCHQKRRAKRMAELERRLAEAEQLAEQAITLAQEVVEVSDAR